MEFCFQFLFMRRVAGAPCLSWVGLLMPGVMHSAPHSFPRTWQGSLTHDTLERALHQRFMRNSTMAFLHLKQPIVGFTAHRAQTRSWLYLIFMMTLGGFIIPILQIKNLSPSTIYSHTTCRNGVRATSHASVS